MLVSSLGPYGSTAPRDAFTGHLRHACHQRSAESSKSRTRVRGYAIAQTAWCLQLAGAGTRPSSQRPNMAAAAWSSNASRRRHQTSHHRSDPGCRKRRHLPQAELNGVIRWSCQARLRRLSSRRTHVGSPFASTPASSFRDGTSARGPGTPTTRLVLAKSQCGLSPMDFAPYMMVMSAYATKAEVPHS